MRVAFLSHKPHLNGLYRDISNSKNIEKVFLYSRFSKDSTELANDRLEFRPITVRTFGVRFIINKLLRQDFYSPNYIPDLSKHLKSDHITHLVLFDFFHWYVFQALYYKKQNPDVSLYLWSETKEWPKRSHSRMIMQLFLRSLSRRSDMIDTIFVYTKQGRDFMNALFPDSKIEIVPAPVDTKLFKQMDQQDIPAGKANLRILCNARFSPYKNHNDLFKAVRILIDTGHPCRLTLIGRAESGRERVEEMVRDNRLEEYVTFFNPLPMHDMPALYRAHDVLVLPSYNEAIGMVVPEAMACGIPTITSDTVGANVYVIPDQTGLIFKTGNVEALAAALKYYIDQPEVRVQHGERAAVHIVEHYSVAKIAHRFLTLLDPHHASTLGVENLKNI